MSKHDTNNRRAPAHPTGGENRSTGLSPSCRTRHRSALFFGSLLFATGIALLFLFHIKGSAIDPDTGILEEPFFLLPIGWTLSTFGFTLILLAQERRWRWIVPAFAAASLILLYAQLNPQAAPLFALLRPLAAAALPASILAAFYTLCRQGARAIARRLA